MISYSSHIKKLFGLCGGNNVLLQERWSGLFTGRTERIRIESCNVENIVNTSELDVSDCVGT